MFKPILEAYYKGDTETIELMTSEHAQGVLTGIISQRKKNKIECQYKEVLYMEEPRYHNCIVNDEDNVRFQFIINVQEINCLINSEDGSIKEGRPTLVENCYYLVELMINPEPVVHLIGHYWVFTRVERTGVVEQLI